jgi:hypothetical protein
MDGVRGFQSDDQDGAVFIDLRDTIRLRNGSIFMIFFNKISLPKYVPVFNINGIPNDSKNFN